MRYPIDQDKILKWVGKQTDPDDIQVLRLQCEEIVAACEKREQSIYEAT